jgi:hypothetical protein
MVGLLCTCAFTAHAQNHFAPVWTGTPYLAMNVYVTAAACDSIALGAADEIALFDGPLCVGSAVLQGPIAAGVPLALIASTDDPTTAAVDGFTPGQLLSFRIWKASPGFEYPDGSIERVFAAGTGTYASLGTAVVTLAGRRVTGVTTREGVPVHGLFRNYPNPFNPVTTIRFVLPERQRIVLTVYEPLGREVAGLFNGVLDAGEHAVPFDGSRLAGGVYFCRITAGEHAATITLILQR